MVDVAEVFVFSLICLDGSGSRVEFPLYPEGEQITESK